MTETVIIGSQIVTGCYPAVVINISYRFKTEDIAVTCSCIVKTSIVVEMVFVLKVAVSVLNFAVPLYFVGMIFQIVNANAESCKFVLQFIDKSFQFVEFVHVNGCAIIEFERNNSTVNNTTCATVINESPLMTAQLNSKRTGFAFDTSKCLSNHLSHFITGNVTSAEKFAVQACVGVIVTCDDTGFSKTYNRLISPMVIVDITERILCREGRSRHTAEKNSSGQSRNYRLFHL